VVLESEDTLPSLEELRARLREKLGLKETEASTIVTLEIEVPPRVAEMYESLSPEEKEALEKRFAWTLAAYVLGYLELTDLPYALLFGPDVVYRIKRFVKRFVESR